MEVEDDDDFWKKIAKIYSTVSNNREDQIIILIETSFDNRGLGFFFNYRELFLDPVILIIEDPL